MKDETKKFSIMQLFDPALCRSCRFFAMATVEMADGSSRRLMHCKRLDCDNWETQVTDERPRTIFDVR